MAAFPDRRQHLLVIGDRDIWRAAALMLKRYGSDAVAEAGKRIEEMEGAGDHAGAAIWRRISLAAEELARTEAPGGRVN
jgi:hypothetical protein